MAAPPHPAFTDRALTEPMDQAWRAALLQTVAVLATAAPVLAVALWAVASQL